MPSVVYAKHDGVEIGLDYYLPPGDGKCPILLWFHGGGLLMGSRKAAWSHLRNAPEKHGLCMVTADYRLAPQTRMPGIMRDISACLAYLRSSAFASETGERVDQSRVIVSGGSAGGWLALLLGSGVGFEASGLEAPEPPLGVCAIYPITDITAPFWTTPQHRAYYFRTLLTSSRVVRWSRDPPQCSGRVPRPKRTGNELVSTRLAPHADVQLHAARGD